MRRFLVILVIALLACRTLTPALPTATPSPAVAPPPTFPVSTPTPSPQVQPTLPAIATTAPAAAGFTVRYHPDGGLYVGDQVSLEVIAPQGMNLKDHRVQVQVLAPLPADLAEVGFNAFGIGGRPQATLYWVWDTRGLAPGRYTLSFSIHPDGPAWMDTVQLNPQDQLPPFERGAHWETAQSECCTLYYISGTDAARDIQQLSAIADQQARKANQQMGVDFGKPIPITVLSRVLGQGGFTSSEIAISYLDLNYAGNDFAQVLHHEMIHILDARLGGELRPNMLVEGLAVYLSGGHYKPEPLLPRAAALVALGQYLPLAPLIDDFYNAQHEIGYLEGAALIEYMVDTWGWQAYSNFYRDIHPQPGGKQSAAIDAALQAHFGLSLSALEGRFLNVLHRQHVNPDVLADLSQTLDYYDTMRRYQMLLDPSAYFLTAWLPDTQVMRKRGIVADYLRHPSAPLNLQIESLLVGADADLRAGNYFKVQKLLAFVNAELDALDTRPSDLRAGWYEGEYLAPQVVRIDIPQDADHHGTGQDRQAATAGNHPVAVEALLFLLRRHGFVWAEGDLPGVDWLHWLVAR
jgi:hypothetical protein